MFLKKLCVFILFSILFYINTSLAKITDEEYAQMPILFYFDNYDHCMLYDKNALYCKISLQLYPKNSNNFSEVWNIIKEVTSSSKYYRHDLLRHGLCISEIWQDIKFSELTDNYTHLIDKLEQYYNEKYKNKELKGKIDDITCETNNSIYKINTFDVIFGFFLVVFVLLVISASIYDVFYNKNTNKFVNSFSLVQNWNRLNTVNLENTDLKALRCMQGIRFYSMLCVIFGHTFTVMLSVPVLNTKYTESITDNFSVKWIGDGTRHTTVQIYFMISAWLLTLKFFTNMERKKGISINYIIRLFIDRYFRLTPILVIVNGFYGTWLVHISRGPVWDELIGEEYRKCRKNWWSNLFYLSNFIHREEMCAEHQWYLAVDTQLYIFGLLILTVIWYNQNKFISVLISLWFCHIIILFFMMFRFNWQSYIQLYPEIIYKMNIVHLDTTKTVYKTIISNMGAFIIGIFYGIIFYKYKNKKMFTKKTYKQIWWILCLVITIGIIILPGLMRYVITENYKKLYDAIYGTFNKTTFAFGTGLLIFGITQGEGNIIKSICEWPPTYILGRLTYNAFLIHPLFQRLKVGIKRLPIYIDDQVMIFETIGDITSAYIGALILCLFFEMPLSQIRKKFNKKENILIKSDLNKVN